MARMGHSNTRAALIYQHSTDERQREVARKLDELASGASTHRARPQSKAHNNQKPRPMTWAFV